MAEKLVKAATEWSEIVNTLEKHFPDMIKLDRTGEKNLVEPCKIVEWNGEPQNINMETLSYRLMPDDPLCNGLMEYYNRIYPNTKRP